MADAQVGDLAHPSALDRAARRWRPGGDDLPLLVTAVVAVAFLIVDPPVGDLWAARARQNAAEHGVGLRYWFSWFGGIVPGHYSVLEPTLTRVVSTEVLGAVSAVLVVVLVRLLVRGSRHPLAASWTAAGATALNLWSGRIPFAIGTVLMLLGALLVRSRRGAAAAVLTLVTVLVSPVSAAFLALGSCGVVLHDRARRRAGLLVIVAAGAGLLAVGAYFGQPGPEGFDSLQATFALLAILVMLLARPAPAVRTVLLLSLAVWAFATFVPNGLGGNFERFTWMLLPVACVATARAGLRIAATVCALAVACSAVGTSKDLWVAAQPQSSTAYYAGVLQAVEARRSSLLDHRLEVVPDGTHLAADLLLNHAYLARGYETQSDNEYDEVLNNGPLGATRYRRWLDDNAVAFVLLDHVSTQPSAEDALVRRHRPSYLRPVWSDRHWNLYAVRSPAPIAPLPARVITADQAELTLRVDRPATLEIRVRWSRLLDVRPGGGGSGTIGPAGDGWTRLRVSRAGVFVFGG